MKSKQSQPNKNAEGSECTCESEEEHQQLLARLDESYKQEGHRAQMRQSRSTAYLRAQVTREMNGG